jgi:hypothetical protein
MAQSARNEKTVVEHADEAVRQAGPYIQRIARFGLAMKGALYIMIGALALEGALWHSTHIRADKTGAFREILMRPFGRALLMIVAMGLFAYALWRILSAVFDLERDGREVKAIGHRAGRLIGGIVYGSLGAGAVRLVIGYASARSSDSVHDWSAWALDEPLGRWAIAIAALATAGRGLQQMYKSIRFNPTQNLSTSRMGEFSRRTTMAAGRIGLAARGVVFLLVSAFLLAAAFYSDPNKARGLGATLSALERAPYGAYALFTVALGLIAYGLFSLMEARYRRIPTQPPRT